MRFDSVEVCIIVCESMRFIQIIKGAICDVDLVKWKFRCAAKIVYHEKFAKNNSVVLIKYYDVRHEILLTWTFLMWKKSVNTKSYCDPIKIRWNFNIKFIWHEKIFQSLQFLVRRFPLRKFVRFLLYYIFRQKFY